MCTGGRLRYSREWHHSNNNCFTHSSKCSWKFGLHSLHRTLDTHPNNLWCAANYSPWSTDWWKPNDLRSVFVVIPPWQTDRQRQMQSRPYLLLGYVELCAKILQIMRALFANYAHIMCTFIGLVLHTFGIQHRQCDIIWCISQTCYFHRHRLWSTTQTWCQWLLLSHLPILTPATSSLWVSWCPVHIGAAAVSPSCGNTYCVEL